MTSDYTMHELEALKVGPDEVLILRIAKPPEDEYDWTADLRTLLIEVGLGDRSLIIAADGDEIELAKVKK